MKTMGFENYLAARLSTVEKQHSSEDLCLYPVTDNIQKSNGKLLESLIPSVVKFDIEVVRSIEVCEASLGSEVDFWVK